MLEALDYPLASDGRVWLHRSLPRPHPMHHHDDLEFTLMTRGSARCIVGGRRYDLTPGDLLWLFPAQEHQIVDMSSDFSCWILVIRQRALRGLGRDPTYAILAQRDPPGSWLRRPSRTAISELSSLFEDLARAPQVRANAGMRYALLRTWDAYSASAATQAATLHPGVVAACTALAGNPGDQLSAVARDAGLSLSRLTHLFRAQLGTTLTAHRARQRIELFQRLGHSHPQRTVLSLALAAGFGSYPQFHRMFVRHVGQTPAAWMASK